MKLCYTLEKIEEMVKDYNTALGIDPEKHPHKKVGIYKMLDHALSPILNPKLNMQNRKVKIDEIDKNDPNVQHLRHSIREKKLKHQKLSHLHHLKSIANSMRLAAMSDGEYSFLNTICDVIAPQPKPIHLNPPRGPFRP